MNRDKSLSISKLDSFSSQNDFQEPTNSTFDNILSQGDSGQQSTSVLRELTVVKLNGISIKPSHSSRAPVLNLRQQFVFPSSFGQNGRQNFLRPVEQFTQTNQDIELCHSFSRATVANLKFNYNGLDESEGAIKAITVERKPEQRPTYPIQRPRPCSKSSRKRFKTDRPASSVMNPVEPEAQSAESDSPVLNLNDIPTYLEQAVDSLQDAYWESNLQGLKILLEILHLVDWQEYEKCLPIIGRRLVDLIKSPRSMLVRIVCQTSGEIFRASRCFKRPEFEELVLLLLQKTGDPNRFIRKDANVALDKMVTFVPFFHSVRTLSAEGPQHKSTLVRIATARLFVCVCALARLDLVLGTESNARSRRRVLFALQTFLLDKNLETR